jgi:hypothetical protein
MLIVAGGLLVAAQLLRFVVSGAEWRAGGWAGVDTWYLVTTVLLLLVGVLCIRYGWRLRLDGRFSDEPGKGRIS